MGGETYGTGEGVGGRWRAGVGSQSVELFAFDFDPVACAQVVNPVEVEHPEFAARVEEMAKKVAQEFVPFDYGRIEFRVDLATGDINFIEINLNCNLWSEKVMAKAAAQAGFSHSDLLETLLAESWRRNALIS